MKKVLLSIIFAAVIATGTAFAEYPNNKIGVGIIAGYNGSWEGGGSGNLSLSLKLPQLPIFWAARLEIDGDWFALGVHGDYYIYHEALLPEYNLDWYLGIGAWVSIWAPNDNLGLALGLRLPIGLSWQPIDILEVFLEIAPSLGIQVLDSVRFPAGGFGIGLGIRVWF